jgi:hypothetical protein
MARLPMIREVDNQPPTPEPAPAAPPHPRGPAPASSNLAAPAAILVAAILVAALGGDIGRIVFLVCMGGVLAYLGDILGGRFGKKRLSLMGLRPKHTALVFSVLTGLAITIATLVGVSVISKPFRVMLFHADELIAREKHLQVAVEERRQERDKLSIEAAALTSRVAELVAATNELDARNDQLTKEIENKTGTLVVFQLDKPLLPQPFMFPIDISQEQLKQVMGRQVEEIRRVAKLRGVTLPANPAELAHLDQVIPDIYQDIQKLRDRYRKRKESGTMDYLPTQCFVEALSDRNVNIGEKLHNVNFRVGTNIRIFEKGERVASFTIDGTRPRKDILDQLFYFDRRVMFDMQGRGVSPYSLEARGRQFTAGMLLKFVGLADLIERRKTSVSVELFAVADILVHGDLELDYRLVKPEVLPPGPHPLTATAPAAPPVVSPARPSVSPRPPSTAVISPDAAAGPGH